MVLLMKVRGERARIILDFVFWGVGGLFILGGVGILHGLGISTPVLGDMGENHL